MNQAYQKSHNLDNNISKTGYRALFLLMKLIKSPKTRDEILECFNEDLVIRGDLSRDTATNTVNTLREAGCIISRPTQRTKNKYILSSHPFNIYLSKENIYALQALRESIISLGDWRLVLNLNNLYAKISNLAPDNETKNILLNEHPFKKINHSIINALLVLANIKKQTNICYNSPENGEESFDFSPEYITLENRKLYVWGYCQKHDNFSYLRIDRIKQVNLMNFLGENPEAEDFEKKELIVDYKLKNLSAMMFIENENEKIIAENINEEYPITVRTTVSNKFNFFQRILSFGADCKLISPEEIKQELIEKLKAIKAGYSDDTASKK